MDITPPGKSAGREIIERAAEAALVAWVVDSTRIIGCSTIASTHPASDSARPGPPPRRSQRRGALYRQVSITREEVRLLGVGRPGCSGAQRWQGDTGQTRSQGFLHLASTGAAYD